jgi:glycosyltransferase involved in cell wall biosynthesis
VYTEHSLHGENSWASRTLRHLTGRLDDVSLAVSESNRDALPAQLRSRTRVILHGIDLDHAQPARTRDEVRHELGIDPTAPVALCVANLTEQKGHIHLLAASRLLRSEGLDVTLLGAGDGPLRTELLERRDAEGLEERVHYLGARGDVPDLMSAADVLVLASNWECMPVVVMEAFAVGLPVVVTATGDLPLVVIPGHNGLLVPPGRPEELARAMASVLTDDALRSVLARGAADSAARFDARRTTRELEELYGELVAR